MIASVLLSFIKDKNYRYLIYTTFIVLILGSVCFKYFEDWEWIDAISYSVSVMVTTGNADVSPQTMHGKIFNIFYMIISVILILFFVNVLFQHFHENRMNAKEEDKKNN
ncbi:potassium channel family protein [Frigoriflavimonas asaccharolytica]|uniref:High-affinity Fe2+/Pb2+ permease n=1 Tax=Frigoriflavimonas asaccharolytica TaxID=2735899 RepID=A0A8J8G9C9_9FLAO|nr:potassium channel family protein [Frigoriflavimonas asaccharolytica]NRS91372.1 high-affinity Fe2+/Pb2+ permease [Frigoriflavimonas asaccharolytica]